MVKSLRDTIRETTKDRNSGEASGLVGTTGLAAGQGDFTQWQIEHAFLLAAEDMALKIPESMFSSSRRHTQFETFQQSAAWLRLIKELCDGGKPLRRHNKR